MVVHLEVAISIRVGDRNGPPAIRARERNIGQSVSIEVARQGPRAGGSCQCGEVTNVEAGSARGWNVDFHGGREIVEHRDRLPTRAADEREILAVDTAEGERLAAHEISGYDLYPRLGCPIEELVVGRSKTGDAHGRLGAGDFILK